MVIQIFMVKRSSFALLSALWGVRAYPDAGESGNIQMQECADIPSLSEITHRVPVRCPHECPSGVLTSVRQVSSPDG